MQCTVGKVHSVLQQWRQLRSWPKLLNASPGHFGALPHSRIFHLNPFIALLSCTLMVLLTYFSSSCLDLKWKDWTIASTVYVPLWKNVGKSFQMNGLISKPSAPSYDPCGRDCKLFFKLPFNFFICRWNSFTSSSSFFSFPVSVWNCTKIGFLLPTSFRLPMMASFDSMTSCLQFLSLRWIHLSIWMIEPISRNADLERRFYWNGN